MFVYLAVALVLSWILGVVIRETPGASIHLLLVGAVLSILWHYARGGLAARREQAARLAHDGERDRTSPPLLLRAGSDRGHHYIVS